MTPATWTITERAIRGEIRSVPDGGWPGVRGITVVAQMWGGDQLALAGGVVRLLSAALAAATPPQGTRIAEELLRSLERAARQLAGEATRRASTSADLVQALEKAQRLRADTMEAALREEQLVLRGRQRDNLRDALAAVLLELASGRAQLGSRTSSPAVEHAQDALVRTPRTVPVPGGPR